MKRFHTHEKIGRVVLLYLLLACWFNASSRQVDSLHFIRLGVENGLPDASINALTQDGNGFLWIGTANGLSRYDGTEFRNFFHSKDSNSLPGNCIIQLLNYDSSHLLIATTSGLCMLNTQTLQCTNLVIKSSALMFSRDNSFRAMAVDAKKNIWAGSRTTLYYLSPDFKIIRAFKGYDEKDYNTLRMLYVYDIVVLPDNDVLLRLENRVTGGGDYFIYNAAIDTLQPLPMLTQHPLHFLSRYWSGYLKTDDKGNIHFLKLYSDSLCTYNLHTKQLHHTRLFFTNNPSLLRRPTMNTRVLNAGYQTLVCALETEGGFTVLPSTFPSAQLRSVTQTVYFKGHTIAAAKQDRDGNLWIGGDNGLHKSLTRFKNVQSAVINRQGPVSFTNRISFVNDEVWISSDPAGYFVFNKELKPVRHVLLKGNPLLNNTWSAQRTASKDTVWLGTQYGLRWYHTKANTNGTIPAPGKPVVMDTMPITANFSDSKGLMWIGIGFGNGVVQYNPATKSAIHYPASGAGNCIPIRYPMTIAEDYEDNLWMGNHDGVGLARWIRKENRFDLILADYYSTFDNAYITNLLCNRKKQLWIATMNGLFKYDIPTKRFTKYDVSDGLPSNALMSMTEDGHGRIWIGTTNGLSCLYPDKQKFVNFLHPNALLEPGIQWVAFDSSTKKVFFNTMGFINSFYPQNLLSQFSLLHLQITGVQIGNKEQSLQSFYTIPYNQNDISFSFTAINFANGPLNKYYYRLKGKEWISLGTQRQVNFLNLSPGNYSFSLKAVNSAGVWSNETIIHFTIRRPWWQTWWFRIAALAAIAGILLLLVKRRIQYIGDKAEFKQKIAETEMMALRAQMNPHFIFNCINSIDALILSNDKYHATIYLNKFARLLRNILDSSKQNTVPLTKDLETLQLYIDLEQLRDENKFIVLINTDEALLQDDYKVPPLIVQPYVENAILHGLKHRRDNNGQLTIKVSKQQDYIEYVIEDNGVGRQASKNGIRKDASYGMQMSRDRVKYFNHEETASVVVTDLQEQGLPTGTRVQVLLKMQ